MGANELWAECAWRMHQLQAAAQFVRSTPSARGWLVRLLRMMETLRAFVNEAVLLDQNDRTKTPSCDVLRVAGLLVACAGEAFDWQSPSREAVGEERRVLLQRELETLKRVQASGEEPFMKGSARYERLRKIIVSLRKRDQGLAFHRGLLVAVTQRDGAYSTDNFAYGSTPLDSWVRVCISETVRCAIRQWPTPQRPETSEHVPVQASDTSAVTTPIAVVGSSSGSLVFFTSTLLGYACTGIEILPFLHSVAEELKDKHKPTNCCFLQADVLSTTLTGVRLIVLTSQCWDANLYDQVLSKLERELAIGSLVVDYRDGLSKSNNFHLAERIDGLRVSWNQDQSFFIYGRC